MPLVCFTVGDLHGDMRKTKKAMQLARVAEEKADGQLVWIGGDTVVVQLGDVLDRGDCEIGKPQESGLAASYPTCGRSHQLVLQGSSNGAADHSISIADT